MKSFVVLAFMATCLLASSDAFKLCSHDEEHPKPTPDFDDSKQPCGLTKSEATDNGNAVYQSPCNPVGNVASNQPGFFQGLGQRLVEMKANKRAKLTGFIKTQQEKLQDVKDKIQDRLLGFYMNAHSNIYSKQEKPSSMFDNVVQRFRSKMDRKKEFFSKFMGGSHGILFANKKPCFEFPAQPANEFAPPCNSYSPLGSGFAPQVSSYASTSSDSVPELDVRFASPDSEFVPPVNLHEPTKPVYKPVAKNDGTPVNRNGTINANSDSSDENSTEETVQFPQ